MSQLGQPSDETQVDEEAEDNIQSESLPIPKITSYKEAIIALEDVQTFLESCGHLSTSITYIGHAVDAITSLKVTSMTTSLRTDSFIIISVYSACHIQTDMFIIIDSFCLLFPSLYN